MITRPLLMMTAIVACGACTPRGPTQTPAQGPPAGTAATGPQVAGGRQNIVGKVATNPWHAIKGGGVVYLQDGPKDAGISLSGTLDNHDMAFVPKIVVITAGGSVVFTNTDPVMHNVFSPDGDKWDLGVIPQNSSAVKQFDTPQIYTVLCNLHSNMLAYLVVSPSNYFARTDPEGGYVIKNVPPGTYHVTAWVPRLKSVTQVITVSGEEATLNFDLER